MDVHTSPAFSTGPQDSGDRIMRVLVCGETYSSNLGDQVIAESLAFLIRMHIPDAKVDFLDISGRASTERYPATVAHPTFSGHGRRPRVWVQQMRELKRTALAWMAPWQPPRQPYDLVVIGGGHLLMDNDLWFPSRLAMWHHRLKPHARAYAIHACGVGEDWSGLGRRLCLALIHAKGMVSRSVRDDRSREYLIRRMGILPDRISVVPDPAVWAAEAYRTARIPGSRTIGLGIMGPTDLAQGIDPLLAGRLTRAVLLQFWTEVIALLDQRGWDIRLFTNGAPEDHAFAERLLAQLPMTPRSPISLSPRPGEPQELMGAISGFCAVIAQRLHALVIACSLDIPFIGLVWDQKVRDFCAMCGHPDRAIEPDGLDASAAVTAMEQAVASGLDPAHREDLRGRAAAGVQSLLQTARRI